MHPACLFGIFAVGPLRGRIESTGYAMFVFRSRKARLTVILGVVILAVVFLPVVILNLGECSGTLLTDITCDHVPHTLGHLFHGLHLFIDFTTLLTARPFFESLGAALIIFGFFLEITVRRRRKK